MTSAKRAPALIRSISDHVVERDDDYGSPHDDATKPYLALLEATRALLWVKSPEEAAHIAETLIQELGGAVVSASHARDDVLDFDVSFGVGDPLYPVGGRSRVVRQMLEAHLPTFLLDAHRALELAEEKSRFAHEASVDSLTGLLNRRMLDRLLRRLRTDDTVVVIDLDNFKLFNDNFGHSEGDRILHAFARALSSVIRATDRAGRFGGDEFVVILSESAPNSFFVRLQNAWLASRPHPLTFSAGLAQADEQPERAFVAADRAMYRAKVAGRNQCTWTKSEDFVAPFDLILPSELNR
ncbi:MAG: GGDEF domain-containing protein [Acidimicrobiales bacterium]